MTIASHNHPYSIFEWHEAGNAVAAAGSGPSAFFLIDGRVAELYPQETAAARASGRAILVEASEHAKSYERLAPVFCRLLEMRVRRTSTLVVIGGGVLQDVGCFISSVLMRGIRWALVPTTLLSQCDSCIGSKSSLNVGKFKNQLGTFYPPHEIHVSARFLDTLPPEAVLSGLGEMIKLHLLDGEEATERLFGELGRAPDVLDAAKGTVLESLRIKQRYIEQDEFDRGVRNLLNYGHTFAHGFESASDYAIPHGIAVTLGIAAAVNYSQSLGLLPKGSFAPFWRRVQPYCGGHERRLAAIPGEAVLAAMKHDKKNEGDAISHILTRGPGRMEKVPVAVGAAGGLLGRFFLAITKEGTP
jgi:3-dehydroquinate synthase